MDFVDFNENFLTFRLLIVAFAMLSSVLAKNSSTPRPNSWVECTSQNCIFSYTKMDDVKFNEMISSDAGSGILAVKFS